MPPKSSKVRLELGGTNNNRAEEDVLSLKLAVCGLVTIIYIALIMISGTVTYASFGWTGAELNASTVSKTSGFVLTIINQFRGENTTIPSSKNETLIVTGICPMNGTCPKLKCRPPDNTSCIPQPKPPCSPQIWPKRHLCREPVKPCPKGTCPPPECPKQPQLPDIQSFRNSVIESKTVFEWINMFPPNSADRLEVVTTLLNVSIEPFATLGVFHRCTTLNLDRDMHKTVCAICTDRYEYIRCAVSNELTGQLHPNGNNYLTPIFWTPEMGQMHTTLINVIHQDHPTRKLRPIFDRIEDMIRTFAIKTKTGSTCAVCKDFKRTVYDTCYNSEGRWYGQ